MVLPWYTGLLSEFVGRTAARYRRFGFRELSTRTSGKAFAAHVWDDESVLSVYLSFSVGNTWAMELPWWPVSRPYRRALGPPGAQAQQVTIGLHALLLESFCLQIIHALASHSQMPKHGALPEPLPNRLPAVG